MIPIFHKSYNSFSVYLNTWNFSSSFNFLCGQLFLLFRKGWNNKLGWTPWCKIVLQWKTSAKIWSPGQWNLLLIKWKFLTIYVSVAWPPHPFDKKLIAPSGLQEMNEILDCTVFFVIQVNLCLSFQVYGSINEYLKTINDTSQFWKMLFGDRWLSLPYIIVVLPVY